jgi:shikimate kinase
MNGYYDAAPIVLMDKPLALIGPPGGQHHEVGYDLASLSGLPLVNLDQWVEHHAGQSLWQLIQAEGETAYRRLETELLPRALKAQPPSILILGDGALLNPANQRQLLISSTLVYFKLRPSTVYWRLRQQAEAPQGKPHPLVPLPLENPDLIRPLLDARLPGYQQAHRSIDMEEKDVREAVQLLLKTLQALDLFKP